MSMPLLFALAIVCIKSLQSELSNPAASSPNILFIVVDDLGWTDISHHNAEYETPHLDALYSSGIELTNYYIHPDCSPTRSAIMTGKYAWKTGLQNIGTVPPGSTQHIPFDTPTLAELMKAAGYDTRGLGKWHLGYAAWNMTPTGRGFDSYFGMFQGAQTYYNHTINDGFDFFDDKQIYYDAIGKYSNDLYTTELLSILDEYKTESANPFFIYAAFQTVHTPIEVPPKNYSVCDSISTEMRQIYCNKMLYLDEAIGTIISRLKQNGLYDNTLIALSTDNGGMPYWANQNNLIVSWGCNLPYRAGKATLFEGGVKGIGLLSGALIEKAGLSGTQNGILSHCSDWLPTFVEGIAGQELPEHIAFDGMNMMEALGEEADKWNRTELYLNIDTVALNGKPGPFDAIIYNESETQTIWKYIDGKQLYTDYYYCNQTAFGPSNLNEGEWLFNISDNPYEEEKHNLVRQYPSKVQQLKAMIKDKVENGGFLPDQDRTVYNEGLPANNDGVWVPWLN